MTRQRCATALGGPRLRHALWLFACWNGVWPVPLVAQPRARLEWTLTVQHAQPGCVSAQALRERIIQFLAPGTRVTALRIEVDVTRPSFRVLRDGQVLAERRFEALPNCSERRDALALAIAIAIEHAVPAQAANGAAAVEDARPKVLDAIGPDSDAGARKGRADARPGTLDATGTEPAATARNGSAVAAAQAEAARSPDATRTVEPAPSGSGRSSDAQSAGAGNAARTKPQVTAPQRSLAAPQAQPTAAGQPAQFATSPQRTQASAARPPAAAATQPGEAASPEAKRAERAGSGLDAGVQRDADEAVASHGAERPQARWMLHAGGAYLTGALPSPAVVFALGGEFALLPLLRVGVSGLMSAPSETAFATGRVSSQLYGGQAQLCTNVPLFAVLVHGCAGASAALVAARGDGFSRDLPGTMAWVSALLGIKLEFPVRAPVAMRVFADARANLIRPEMRVERMSLPEVSQAAAAWGGSAGAELVVRLD
jgi:hypothetical protein